MVSVLVTALTAVTMLCFIALDIVPCRNKLFRKSAIWSGVPALITGVKFNVVAPLICP